MTGNMKKIRKNFPLGIDRSFEFVIYALSIEIVEPKTQHPMKLISTAQAEKLFLEYERGANWIGNTTLSMIYTVPDSDSRSVGGEKALQKTVMVPACMSGADYEAKVNRFRQKEGVAGDEPFKAEPPKGFQRVNKDNRMLLESLKAGERAVMAYIDPSNADKMEVLEYRDAKTGEKVEKDQIGDYLTPSGYRNKFEGRPASRAQKDIPYEKRFRIVRPYLKNVDALKLGGETYIIKKEQGGSEMDAKKAEDALA